MNRSLLIKLLTSKSIVLVFCLIFASCARITATQRNIKKVNDQLLEMNKPIPFKKEIPIQKTSSDSDKPIPLGKFLNPNFNQTVQYSNSWFKQLMEWSKTYRDIAVEEMNLRNFYLSEKYSHISVTWLERALHIKNMNTAQATKMIIPWLDVIKLPKLPEEPRYFTGHDAYNILVETKKVLESHPQRTCLLAQGIQIITAQAYLEFSVDLLNQKSYARALTVIQMGWSLISSLQTEKSSCEDPKDSTNK